MELWLLLGILSYLSYAISTSIDKFFMNNGHEPANTNMFKMFFDGLILLIIGLLFFEINITTSLILWSLLLGTLYAFSGILYFISLKCNDVEIVIPYSQSLSVLLIFIASIIAFDEIVNNYNYIGIIFILIGIYVVLSKDGLRFPKIDKAVLLIFGMVILGVIYSLVAKKVLFDADPISLSIMMYFSCSFVNAVYNFFRKQKMASIKDSKIIVASFFGAIGTLLLFSALSVGNASKVYPLAGLQSVFIFIIASLFLKEKFQWHRLIGTMIVFAGVWFVSV